jgi:ribonucleotide monophosphatase NagD (HAD superfamily)
MDECRGERTTLGDPFVLLANNGNKTEGEVSQTLLGKGGENLRIISATLRL